MISSWEQHYAYMIRRIAVHGAERETRNSVTKSLFGMNLTVDMSDGTFPLLLGRKMYPQGVFGELAAMLRQPKHIDDFTQWGCNYWNKFANADGSINVDYGNAWFDFNGKDQIADLKDKLANDPTNRRMMVTSWRPDNLDNLSLPCCHHTYQFYVADGVLSMLWMQRSVDMMVGLPSDIAFAGAWLLAICNEFGFEPGQIHFSLGDCHVYESHYKAADVYVERVADLDQASLLAQPTYDWIGDPGSDFCEFNPVWLQLENYNPLSKLPLELIV